jgi:hypothetical protein
MTENYTLTHLLQKLVYFTERFLYYSQKLWHNFVLYYYIFKCLVSPGLLD